MYWLIHSWCGRKLVRLQKILILWYEWNEWSKYEPIMDEKKVNDQCNDLSQIEDTDPLMFYKWSSDH